jgi:hypothetical protein
MSKKDPVLVALGDVPAKWNTFLLKTYGLPQDPSTRKEIQQDSIRVIDSQFKRPKAWSLDKVGGLIGSATQADNNVSVTAEAAKSVKLSPEWARYLEYMDVIAEALSPKDNGASLKQLALDDARSRHRDQPPGANVFRPMNASLATPAEFRQLWFYGELEIRAYARNRREHVFEIWQLPPDEPDPADLDEAGEPSGNCDGLKWTATPPKN